MVSMEEIEEEETNPGADTCGWGFLSVSVLS
jgi:hypothetical protein